MNNPARKTEWLVWSGLALVIVAVVALFARSKLGHSQTLPIIRQISAFNLTNQDNQPVSLASLRGQVWVANIIFTRCPGPCTEMSHQLAQIQSELPAGQPVRLVTLTSDPDFDTPPVLKKYATRFGADTNRWSFLTGPKKEIRELAVNDFNFAVVEKPPSDRTVPDDLFIHSIFFMLVDQQGRTRGWTDGEGRLHAFFDSQDSAARAELLAAIKQLLDSPAL